MTSPFGDDKRSVLAVLGKPIAHSLSPTLHCAAYKALGVPWSYSAEELSGGDLREFLDSCDERWRGLSLTMPLKRDVIPLLTSTDELSGLTGVANTVLFSGRERHGFNTDVAGITRALAENGVVRLREVVILGGGATAVSALVAARELGAEKAHAWMRNPTRATAVQQVAERLGVELELSAFTDANDSVGHPDVVFSTLPNGSVVDLMFAEAVRKEAVLFDVAYDPWPTPLAASWLAAGGQVVSGLQMLVNQALMQVRIFYWGEPGRQLPDEPRVLEAMRASIRPVDTQQ